MRRILTAVFACLLIAAPALAEPETLTVSAGKTPREAIVHVPGATEGPLPVVLVFHGGGGAAEWMANRSTRSPAPSPAPATPSST